MSREPGHDMNEGVTVATPTDREIVLSRVFRAPRELVFDAFTVPELLLRWYGARGWNLIVCEVDLRIGGAWRYVSRGPGDETMGQRGLYREIARPERLVFTERFDDQSYPGDSLVTHLFAGRDGDTALTTTVRYATKEGRDTVLRYPMARGVGESFERLADVLAELTRAR